MRAGILLRLSEEKDTAEATAEAFERFEAACRRLCDSRGWAVAEVFRDGVVSAFKGRKRAGFDQAMVALLDGTIDVLVVSDLDRLLRSWRDAARVDDVIRESGRTVVSSDGRDIATDPSYPVLVGIAIAESKRIGKRVRAQVTQAIAKGRPAPGPRPFGFEPGGLEIRESEAAVIRETVRRLLTGESMGAILNDLRDRGVTGAGGRLFTTTSLRNVVTNPRIAGLRVHCGKVAGPGAWPAIISERDLADVRRIFTGRQRQAKGTKPGRGRSYVYSGLLLCAPCGGRLAGSSGAYRCQSCRRSYVQAGPLEDFLAAAFRKRVTSPDFARVRAARLEALEAGDTTARDLERNRAELADLEAVPERFRATVDPDGKRAVELARLVREGEARLSAMPGAAALLDMPRTESELRAAWKGWTVEQKRARVAAVLESVTVRPATRRHIFQPERLDPLWRA